MKYFITATGLVPFELTAMELLELLTEEEYERPRVSYLEQKRRPFGVRKIVIQKGRTPHKFTSTDDNIAFIQQCMDSETVIFKHPNTKYGNILIYSNGNYDHVWRMNVFCGHLDISEQLGVGYVITNFQDGSIFAAKIYTLLDGCLPGLLRKHTIDNILQDLAR